MCDGWVVVDRRSGMLVGSQGRFVGSHPMNVGAYAFALHCNAEAMSDGGLSFVEIGYRKMHWAVSDEKLGVVFLRCGDRDMRRRFAETVISENVATAARNAFPVYFHSAFVACVTAEEREARYRRLASIDEAIAEALGTKNDSLVVDLTTDRKHDVVRSPEDVQKKTHCCLWNKKKVFPEDRKRQIRKLNIESESPAAGLEEPVSSLLEHHLLLDPLLLSSSQGRRALCSFCSYEEDDAKKDQHILYVFFREGSSSSLSPDNAHRRKRDIALTSAAALAPLLLVDDTIFIT